MTSSHSPSTSETTIDRKVGPVSIRSDVEAVALSEVELERLTKLIMYISRVFSKGKKKKNIADTIYLSIDAKLTGGCCRSSEFYVLFRLLTGRILA